MAPSFGCKMRGRGSARFGQRRRYRIHFRTALPRTGPRSPRRTYYGWAPTQFLVNTYVIIIVTRRWRNALEEVTFDKLRMSGLEVKGGGSPRAWNDGEAAAPPQILRGPPTHVRMTKDQAGHVILQMGVFFTTIVPYHFLRRQVWMNRASST